MLYLTHTTLRNRYTLRLCVGQTHTEHRHVQAAWQTIQETAAELECEGTILGAPRASS
ncbi:MAG: hypothetical protein LC647_06000 [Beggiatoa sp.]|nr:hypothetical protein [Beggiatoa sp.]